VASIDRLIERQGRHFDQLQEREARRLMRTLDDARREVYEELQRLVVAGKDQPTPYTAQWTRTMLAQLEAAGQQLRQRFGEAMFEAVERQQADALEQLLKVLRDAEPEFSTAANAIEYEALRRISETRGLLLHRYSVHRYGAAVVDQMQRELAVGVARGLNIRQLRDRLAGPEGVIAGMKSRAELIARMELNSAWNRHHQDSIEAAAAVLDKDLAADDANRMRRKADEYHDLRNHAISRVLHGMVVDVDQPFRVPRAKVIEAHEQIQRAREAAGLPRRRLGGIVWPLDGGHYIGHNYPAHFWERGRVVPWRASWEVG
jgi:hypothetical protein